MFELAEDIQYRAKIKVIGVGGGGNNAVGSMIGDSNYNVELIIANTDAKPIRALKVKNKIQLGNQLTRGLGAGTRPDVGRAAALESRHQIIGAISGADLLFIAAGMGGGTGTGAAPVVAELAREAGILTVGIVTRPFTYEGRVKAEIANRGIDELKRHVDSLIIVPNDRLIVLAGKKMSVFDAFKPADEVLRRAVQGISELIVSEGYINLDFADVRTVMSTRGMAMMGIGVGTGSNKASQAINMAISSPMLEDNDLSEAKGVLVNITGSSNMSFDDYSVVSGILAERLHEDANVKIGVRQDELLEDEIRVTIVATGFGAGFERTEKAKGAIKVSPIKPVYSSDRNLLDIPTIYRQKSNIIVFDDDFDDTPYKIPAFLRKTVD